METGITHLVLRREGQLAAMLPKVKAWGYDGMEVLLEDDGDITFESTAADLDGVRALFDQHGLKMYGMCPSTSQRGSLVSGSEADREVFHRCCRTASAACRHLGIDTILIIPGGVTADVPYDVCYQRSVEGLKSLRPICDEYGVNLAVEYVWNNAFLSPLEMRAALDAVNHPQIGFYMDTGNMMAFGYAEHWIRILGPHIKKVHTKNFRRRPHWSWPSLLSEGDADWPAIMAALREIGYDGPLTSEMSGTAEDHTANAAFTKALYA
ncbi:MAG: sugar phosphate isomerase/epimerase [Fimbriimonadaceae bacterium]|nr:sugar phosphate isomerase/epimerase [Fimbriimonadaceae bacterium]